MAVETAEVAGDTGTRARGGAGAQTVGQALDLDHVAHAAGQGDDEVAVARVVDSGADDAADERGGDVAGEVDGVVEGARESGGEGRGGARAGADKGVKDAGGETADGVAELGAEVDGRVGRGVCGEGGVGGDGEQAVEEGALGGEGVEEGTGHGVVCGRGNAEGAGRAQGGRGGSRERACEHAGLAQLCEERAKADAGEQGLAACGVGLDRPLGGVEGWRRGKEGLDEVRDRQGCEPGSSEAAALERVKDEQAVVKALVEQLEAVALDVR